MELILPDSNWTWYIEMFKWNVCFANIMLYQWNNTTLHLAGYKWSCRYWICKCWLWVSAKSSINAKFCYISVVFNFSISVDFTNLIYAMTSVSGKQKLRDALQRKWIIMIKAFTHFLQFVTRLKIACMDGWQIIVQTNTKVVKEKKSISFAVKVKLAYQMVTILLT